jgi:hypothetical protein
MRIDHDDFEGDLAAFTDLYAIPLLDAHARVFEKTGIHGRDLRLRLEESALDIVEDILPDRSIAVQVEGLPEDVPDEDGIIHHVSTISDWEVYRVRADGAREPASERTQIYHAEHGEWEVAFGLATFVRGALPCNLRIRDVISRALRRRAYYWSGISPLPRNPSPIEESPEDRRMRRREIVAPQLTRLGWSIQRWADHAGVEYKTVRQYMNGATRTLRADTRKSLASALQLAVEDLPA